MYQDEYEEIENLSKFFDSLEKTVEFKPEEVNGLESINISGVTLEEKRIKFGNETINRILNSQNRYMLWIVIFFACVLVAQYVFIGYSLLHIKNIERIDGIIVTAIISVTIETLGIVAIIVKYIFSNQIKEIIEGMYKHSHYSEVKNNN